jgi:hypothetical protein
MDQSFVLIDNTARGSRVAMMVMLWLLVVVPLLALTLSRLGTVFGRTGAGIVGVGLSIVLVVAIALWFSRKQHYTLTIDTTAVRVVSNKGKLIESLDRRHVELEIAQHEYVGRATMRIPVVVLRQKTHELTIGANASEPPPATSRRVPAPRYLLEQQAELPRLIAVLAEKQSATPRKAVRAIASR